MLQVLSFFRIFYISSNVKEVYAMKNNETYNGNDTNHGLLNDAKIFMSNHPMATVVVLYPAVLFYTVLGALYFKK